MVEQLAVVAVLRVLFFFKICKLTMLYADKNDTIQNKRIDDIRKKKRIGSNVLEQRRMGSSIQVKADFG